MKFHWGQCPAHALAKQKDAQIDKALNSAEGALKEAQEWEKLFNKAKTFHEEEIRNLKNHVDNLFKQNEELKKSHTQLEEQIAKYQAKIAHLEEVISDYSKASLLEKAPAYVEIVPLPEPEKPKRKAR